MTPTPSRGVGVVTALEIFLMFHLRKDAFWINLESPPRPLEHTQKARYRLLLAESVSLTLLCLLARKEAACVDGASSARTPCLRKKRALPSRWELKSWDVQYNAGCTRRERLHNFIPLSGCCEEYGWKSRVSASGVGRQPGASEDTWTVVRTGLGESGFRELWLATAQSLRLCNRKKNPFFTPVFAKISTIRHILQEEIVPPPPFCQCWFPPRGRPWTRVKKGTIRVDAAVAPAGFNFDF
jgi:hypothetical protein